MRNPDFAHCGAARKGCFGRGTGRDGKGWNAFFRHPGRSAPSVMAQVVDAQRTASAGAA